MPSELSGGPEVQGRREDEGLSPPGSGEPQATRPEEVLRALQALEGRDIQLWSIVVLMILVLAAGFAALLLPNVMWRQGTLEVEGSYIPQLLFGFIVLIVLFNIYALQQRRLLGATRRALVRQVARREEAERSALIDPLTGTFNRRYLDHMLSKEALRADRLKTSLTLLVIDVDDFRTVNSRFGHIEGDKHLKAVADMLTRTFRGSDTIVRYGGDEFLVVLPEAGEPQAQRAVERLQERVEAWNRAHPGLGYRMKLSCGLAAYTRGALITDVLQIADQRMYLHKNQQKVAD
jgi:diguanylate cyclase (GGDEF)-like protein